jgi:hypothetical protein
VRIYGNGNGTPPPHPKIGPKSQLGVEIKPVVLELHAMHIGIIPVPVPVP